MSEQAVLFKKEGSVAVITLNRPQVFNSFTISMVEEIGQALDACAAQDVRAAVITGSGNAFCAGADVREFARNLEEGGGQKLSAYVRLLAEALHSRVIQSIRRLPKPVVAGVNGVAAGAGFSIALACNVRIASSAARFVMAYGAIGGTPDGGSSFYLPRLIGQGRAMDLCLFNTPETAQQALEMGLVHRLAPAEELSQRTTEIANTLVSGPTAAFGRLKALMDGTWQRDLTSQLEQEAISITEMALTQDFQEGITAFTQKRTPRFKGS